MGEMLLQTERAQGTDISGRKALDGSRELPSNPPPKTGNVGEPVIYTLKDIGLTKRESAEAQRDRSRAKGPTS